MMMTSVMRKSLVHIESVVFLTQSILYLDEVVLSHSYTRVISEARGDRSMI